MNDWPYWAGCCVFVFEFVLIVAFSLLGAQLTHDDTHKQSSHEQTRQHERHP